MTDARLAELTTELEEQGVRLVTGAEADVYFKSLKNPDGSARPALGAFVGGSEPTLYLSSGSTEFIYLHESLHLQEWLADKAAFNARFDKVRELKGMIAELKRLKKADPLVLLLQNGAALRRAQRKLELANQQAHVEAERYVYDTLSASDEWWNLAPEERAASTAYIQRLEEQLNFLEKKQNAPLAP